MPTGYSSSLTWVNPKVKKTAQRQTVNLARRKMCPNSPFWYPDFDLAEHMEKWDNERDRRAAKKAAVEAGEHQARAHAQGTKKPVVQTIRPAFGGKTMKENKGYVTGVETVFTPSWQDGKEEVAEWPSRSEMKYEGDDRISTDRIHGRFLGLPRVPGNDTVNWQQRAIIPQFPMDRHDLPTQAVDTFLRTHDIPDHYISEEDAIAALGKELWDAINLVDEDEAETSSSRR